MYKAKHLAADLDITCLHQHCLVIQACKQHVNVLYLTKQPCTHIPRFIGNPRLSDTPAPNQSNKKKKENVTPADIGNDDDDSWSQANSGSAKKKSHASKPEKEAPKSDFTKMGMFYVKDPSKTSCGIFPPRVNACPNICCRGYACSKSHKNCNHFSTRKNANEADWSCR